MYNSTMVLDILMIPSKIYFFNVRGYFEIEYSLHVVLKAIDIVGFYNSSNFPDHSSI